MPERTVTEEAIEGSEHRPPTRLTAVLRLARSTAVLTAVALIRCYQVVIRPHLIGCCRFYPTCSDYAIEALSVHGLLRGSMLAVGRLARCHPFSPGGIDPVPPMNLRLVHCPEGTHLDLSNSPATAPPGTRTPDPLIKNQLLCQLS